MHVPTPPASGCGTERGPKTQFWMPGHNSCCILLGFPAPKPTPVSHRSFTSSLIFSISARSMSTSLFRLSICASLQRKAGWSHAAVATLPLPLWTPVPVVPNAIGWPEGLLKYIRGDLEKTESAKLSQAAGACPQVPILSPCPHLWLCGRRADLNEVLWLLILRGFLRDDNHWLHVLGQCRCPQEVWGALWGQEVVVPSPGVSGITTGRPSRGGRQPVPCCCDGPAGPSAVSPDLNPPMGTPSCTLNPQAL